MYLSVVQAGLIGCGLVLLGVLAGVLLDIARKHWCEECGDRMELCADCEILTGEVNSGAPRPGPRPRVTRTARS